MQRLNHVDVLLQERRNSIANALELRFSCTNPSIWKKESDQFIYSECQGVN